jgi:hypothetical protein
MRAGFFSVRCFDGIGTQFPFSVTSFIVYGRSQSGVIAAGNRIISGHVSELGTRCVKTHKAGPWVIHPRIKTNHLEKAIDWRELAGRVEQERRERPEQEQGSCVFSSPTSVGISGASFPIDSLPPDFPLHELQTAIQGEAQPSLDGSTDARRFIFAGSRFRYDIFERVGEVFLIEAASLDQASALCQAVAGDSLKDGILTEWCPSIYEA